MRIPPVPHRAASATSARPSTARGIRGASSTTLEARLVAHASTPAERLAAQRFEADLRALETRIGLIEVRFERFAARAEADYRSWRDDTVGRMRAVVDGARRYARAGLLGAADRGRVHSILALVRNALAELDARHAEHAARRAG